MLLTVNIGNFNILVGVYDDDALVFRSQLRCDYMKTADEYAIQLKNLMTLYGVCIDQLDGSIISSVSPALTSALRDAVSLLTHKQIMVVGPGLKTGINIKIDNPAQLGADIVASAAAASSKHSVPCLMINFDTAISVMVMDKNSAIIGGCITAGVKLALEALTTHTAQLPQIDLESTPDTIAGTNTIASMQAGIIIGNACMIDGFIERFSEILGDDLVVIASGDFAPHIIEHCRHTIIYDVNLICDGLRIIYQKNK